MTTAREVATTVLHRVATGDAYAAAVLDAELVRAKLERRDAALATEIVYGALRVVPSLDAAIAKHASRTIEPYAKAAMRAAAYQIRHLSRVPPHAAVDAAVSLVRKERGARVAGFVNAVLRKIERPAEPALPTAVELPAWLSAKLVRDLGRERADAFQRARPLPPPIGLRVRADLDREEVAKRMQGEVELGQLAKHALLVRGAGDPRALPGYAEGHFTIQEEGAQIVGALLDAQVGETVLDACAGRGGKTTLLREAVGPSGSVTAIDLHEQKLDRIAAELARLGLPAVDVEAIDLTVGTGGLEARFARVLVDAPCTGLGTVHRRPELLLRLTKDDPARMAEVQKKILATAAKLCRPGGHVLYAVCSFSREESLGVATAVPELTLDKTLPNADEDGILRIGPWLPGSPDAYAVARLFRV